MTISPRFICVFVVTLSMSSAALSQATSGPAGPTEANPGMTGAAGDNATTSGPRRSGDSTSSGPRLQQPASQSPKEPSKEGTGPDPTAVRESPSITGSGTAGEGS
jgi:hypothetical protein